MPARRWRFPRRPRRTPPRPPATRPFASLALPSPTSPDARPGAVVLRPQRVGQRVRVHDRQALRGARERDVEGAQSLRLLVDDDRGLDDDAGIELQALDEPDRHDRDALVETV